MAVEFLQFLQFLQSLRIFTITPLRGLSKGCKYFKDPKDYCNQCPANSQAGYLMITALRRCDVACFRLAHLSMAATCPGKGVTSPSADLAARSRAWQSLWTHEPIQRAMVEPLYQGLLHDPQVPVYLLIIWAFLPKNFSGSCDLCHIL